MSSIEGQAVGLTNRREHQADGRVGCDPDVAPFVVDGVLTIDVGVHLRPFVEQRRHRVDGHRVDRGGVRPRAL